MGGGGDLFATWPKEDHCQSPSVFKDKEEEKGWRGNERREESVVERERERKEKRHGRLRRERERETPRITHRLTPLLSCFFSHLSLINIAE